MVKPKKIYIYHPSRMYGGGEVLMLRVASWLIKADFDVTLIDFIDGFIAQRTDFCKIIEYQVDNKTEIVFDDASILIANPGSAYSILNCDVVGNPSLFLWQVHPYELPFYLIPGGGFFIEKLGINLTKKIFSIVGISKHLRTFIHEACDKKGLVFMDVVNKKTNEYLIDKCIDTFEYLPIPSNIQRNYLDDEIYANNDNLHVFYLGRIEEFKTASIEKLIEDASGFSRSNTKIQLSIIGDGKDLEKIKNLADKKSHDRFSVMFLGKKSVEDSVRLMKNANLLFAMGTAALEGSKMGIPTVVLDFSYKSIKKSFKYRWLYNTKGYNLAGNIDAPFYKQDGVNFFNLIKEYMGNHQLHASLSYDYFKNNHSIDCVMDKFVTFMLRSNFKLEDLEQCLKFSNGIAWKVLDRLTMLKGNEPFKERLSKRHKIF